MNGLSKDEDLLNFLKEGNKLNQSELINALKDIGFDKKTTSYKIILKHNDIDELIEFYKNALEDNSQKQTGKAIRILREAIAKVHGDKKFDEERKNDEILKKMGITPPSRKTVLEKIGSTSVVSNEEAIKAVIEKKPNPNKKGKRRDLLRERIKQLDDYKAKKKKK